MAVAVAVAAVRGGRPAAAAATDRPRVSPSSVLDLSRLSIQRGVLNAVVLGTLSERLIMFT